MDTFTVHIIIASTCNSIRGKKFLLGSFPDPIPGLGMRLTGNPVMVWTHFVEPKHLGWTYTNTTIMVAGAPIDQTSSLKVMLNL